MFYGLIFTLGLGFYSFAGNTKLPELKDRDVDLAVELVEKRNAVVLDVRSKREWERGHIKAAHLIPIQILQTQIQKVDVLVKSDKNRPIVVYCRFGVRATMAKKMLINAGYTQVTNLGGYRDWPKNYK